MDYKTKLKLAQLGLSAQEIDGIENNPDLSNLIQTHLGRIDWGQIRGNIYDQADLKEILDSKTVEVSETGTATKVANYITIDGEESRIGGGDNVKVENNTITIKPGTNTVVAGNPIETGDEITLERLQIGENHYVIPQGAVTSVDGQTGDVAAVSVESLTDLTLTLGDIKEIVDEINAQGRHVMFDTRAFGQPMYLCTIYIEYEDDTPIRYRVIDGVTGKMALGNYDEDILFATILSELVDAFYSITVNLTLPDATQISSATVTIRTDSATGAIYKELEYSGQPVSCVVPNNFKYYIQITSDLEGYSAPNDVSGLVTANTYINLTFSAIITYAFYIDNTVSDPNTMVKYLGENLNFTPAHMDYSTGVFNYGSWENAFFMPKPCVLKFDGTVEYYLDPNDYTKKQDGTPSTIDSNNTTGNVMMEWGRNGKKIWTKIVPNEGDSTGGTVYICNEKADENYHAWSFINSDGEYVDHFYTPVYGGTYDSDGRLRSLSGVLNAKSKTATQERTGAKANNPAGMDIWDTEVYSDIQLINILLILMGRSLDTQTTFGNGCIIGAEAGMVTNGALNNKGLFYGYNSQNSAVKVFGIENWWGNQWRRYQGHVTNGGSQKVKLCRGTLDGSTTNDYNETGNGYIDTNALITTSDYIKTMKFDNSIGIIPQSVGATQSTYYCDQCRGAQSSCFAFRGGNSYYEFSCGAFAVSLAYAPFDSGWGIGAAPSCKPQKVSLN